MRSMGPAAARQAPLWAACPLPRLTSQAASKVGHAALDLPVASPGAGVARGLGPPVTAILPLAVRRQRRLLQEGARGRGTGAAGQGGGTSAGWGRLPRRPAVLGGRRRRHWAAAARGEPHRDASAMPCINGASRRALAQLAPTCGCPASSAAAASPSSATCGCPCFTAIWRSSSSAFCCSAAVNASGPAPPPLAPPLPLPAAAAALLLLLRPAAPPASGFTR